MLLTEFALRAGGPRHAPTLIGLQARARVQLLPPTPPRLGSHTAPTAGGRAATWQDVVSFGLRVQTTVAVGRLATRGHWHAMVGLVAALLALGHGAMIVFVVLDARGGGGMGGGGARREAGKGLV